MKLGKKIWMTGFVPCATFLISSSILPDHPDMNNEAHLLFGYIVVFSFFAWALLWIIGAIVMIWVDSGRSTHS